MATSYFHAARRVSRDLFCELGNAGTYNSTKVKGRQDLLVCEVENVVGVLSGPLPPPWPERIGR